MDRVRLGRVLGKGARLAARTAVEAVDAASAPSPQPDTRSPVQLPPRPGMIQTPQRPERTRVAFSPGPLRPALNAARAGITAPLRRASRALWHELTGSFFALFAFSFCLECGTRGQMPSAACRLSGTAFTGIARWLRCSVTSQSAASCGRDERVAEKRLLRVGRLSFAFETSDRFRSQIKVGLNPCLRSETWGTRTFVYS